MAGYTKLFNSILASTIWRASDKTRIVWITLLAMSDKDGVAEGSIPGLADMARVSLVDCEKALEELYSPDKYSRTTEYEGRRIEKIEGGWQILNHGKYREKMSADERREYFRKKQQEWRNRKKLSTNVNHDERQSTESTHTEAEAQSKAVKKKPADAGYSVPSCFAEVDGFTAALAGWIEARKKNGNAPTGRAIQILIDRLSEQPARAVAALNEATERGWTTVKWEWLDNQQSRLALQQPPKKTGLEHIRIVPSV